MIGRPVIRIGTSHISEAIYIVINGDEPIDREAFSKKNAYRGSKHYGVDFNRGGPALKLLLVLALIVIPVSIGSASADSYNWDIVTTEPSGDDLSPEHEPVFHIDVDGYVVTITNTGFTDETVSISVTWRTGLSFPGTVHYDSSETITHDYSNDEGTYDITIVFRYNGESRTYVFEDVEVPAYHLSFNSNGGEGSMDVLNGTEIQIPKNYFERDGFIFNYWNTAPDGTGTSYAPGDVLSLKSDDTLYAIWTPDPNGGSVGIEWTQIAIIALLIIIATILIARIFL